MYERVLDGPPYLPPYVIRQGVAGCEDPSSEFSSKPGSKGAGARTVGRAHPKMHNGTQGTQHVSQVWDAANVYFWQVTALRDA